MQRSNGTVFSRAGVIALWVFALTMGCAGMSTTRTGAVHDIRIDEGPSPADLVVNIGDEVRWVNSRTMAVRIDLVGDITDIMSCERGFSSFVGLKRNSAIIKSNESVSLCFSKAGAVNYNVRMESALPGGEKNVNGLVRIGALQK